LKLSTRQPAGAENAIRAMIERNLKPDMTPIHLHR
jgi:hypothetical protein